MLWYNMDHKGNKNASYDSGKPLLPAQDKTENIMVTLNCYVATKHE